MFQKSTWLDINFASDQLSSIKDTSSCTSPAIPSFKHSTTAGDIGRYNGRAEVLFGVEFGELLRLPLIFDCKIRRLAI